MTRPESNDVVIRAFLVVEQPLGANASLNCSSGYIRSTAAESVPSATNSALAAEGLQDMSMTPA
jgi:hypothetical protein